MSRRLEGKKGKEEGTGTLEVPLEKPAADRIQRVTGYTGVKKEVA